MLRPNRITTDDGDLLIGSRPPPPHPWLEEDWMDPTRFDRLTRTLSTAGSRRAALRALLAGTTAVLGLAGAQRTAAQLDCTLKATGARCQSGAECCSGWCKRKRGSRKKFCRLADQQGVCNVENNYCGSSSFPCGFDDSGNICLCFVTTTGRSFCGLGGIAAQDCGCTSDKACEPLGAGAKCVQANVACGCASSTSACLRPCPKLYSE